MSTFCSDHQGCTKGLAFAEQPCPHGRPPSHSSDAPAGPPVSEMKDVGINSVVTTDCLCQGLCCVLSVVPSPPGCFHSNEKMTFGLEVDILSSMLHVYRENRVPAGGDELVPKEGGPPPAAPDDAPFKATSQTSPLWRKTGSQIWTVAVLCFNSAGQGITVKELT